MILTNKILYLKSIIKVLVKLFFKILWKRELELYNEISCSIFNNLRLKNIFRWDCLAFNLRYKWE